SARTTGWTSRRRAVTKKACRGQWPGCATTTATSRRSWNSARARQDSRAEERPRQDSKGAASRRKRRLCDAGLCLPRSFVFFAASVPPLPSPRVPSRYCENRSFGLVKRQGSVIRTADSEPAKLANHLLLAGIMTYPKAQSEKLASRPPARSQPLRRTL